MVVNWALPLDDRFIARKSRVIQGVREGQRDRGYLIVPVIADVYRAWHDAAAYLRYVVMILRRATLDRVIAGEGRISIASVEQ